MPITQDRMVLLLKAAQDYQQGLETIIESFNQQAHMVSTGQRDLQSAWELAQISVNPLLLLSNPIQSAKTIMAESIHFNSHHAQNVKKAEKARISRAKLNPGAKPANTAPKRLDRPVIFKDPTIDRKYTSTDSAQIQTNSSLEFGQTPITEGIKTGTAQFLADLEAKEQYEVKYGKDTDPGLVPKQD